LTGSYNVPHGLSMPLKLRPYQVDLKEDIYAAWNAGYRNVLARLPTGMGKTKTFCSITIDKAILSPEKLPTAIMVHRKELVQQISLTLAEEEIIHNIIAPRQVITGIVASHRRVLNKQYYSYQAPVTVVSVDTLNARIMKHQAWAKSIRLWITDEAAHLLKNNKWGRAVEYFPNAIGLGVTATPRRLDKKGLGRHADGVFDVMVEGPDTRWGIENGFLCKYKIAIPQSDYQRYLRRAGDGADYTREAMVSASLKSHIVGDVVENYIKFAEGKQAILFATDIGTGRRMEERFSARGIKAKLLTSESSDKERLDNLLDFQKKKLQVLINIDLFDEGLDVPGIECVIMARPTMSLSKYLQMCLDEKTEILTCRGWLRHDQITKQDLVAGFNTDTQEIEWCKTEKIIKRERREDERMFAYSSPHLDFRITSNHDLLVKSHSKTSRNWLKEIVDVTAERKSMFNVPVAGDAFFPLGAELTDAEIHFLGWFLTDGTLARYGKKSKCIRIYQCENQKKHLRHIEQTLKDCGFKYFVHRVIRKGKLEKYDPMIYFTIPYAPPNRNFDGWENLDGWWRLKKWIDKSIPEIYDSLSSRQIEVLLESMNLGDGSKPRSISWKQKTLALTCGDNKVMADRLQSLLVRRGFRCNQYTQKPSLIGTKNVYLLRIKKGTVSSIAGTGDSDGSIDQKTYKRSRIKVENIWRKEIVWCVKNRLGTIVTRRNGKVIIMGNCGRGLRPAPGKEHLILIDHVGNVAEHGLPDSRFTWTLDRIVKRREKTNFLRICSNIKCNAPYDRALTECPWCGSEAIKMTRDAGSGKPSLKEVDGDLELLDPETLRELEANTRLEDPGLVAKRVSFKVNAAAGIKAMKAQQERIETQKELSHVIAKWAGHFRHLGYSDRQIHKLFYLHHEKTITEALAEPRAEMLATIEDLKGGITHG